LDETSGANKLIALKDTQWYLSQNLFKTNRDAAVSKLPTFHPGLKSRGAIVVFKDR
jgi:hypothetical protein